MVGRVGRGGGRAGGRRAARRTNRRMNRREDRRNSSDEPQANDAPASQDDMYEELEKLASLKDKGIITEEEFEKKKKEILK